MIIIIIVYIALVSQSSIINVDLMSLLIVIVVVIVEKKEGRGGDESTNQHCRRPNGALLRGAVEQAARSKIAAARRSALFARRGLACSRGVHLSLFAIKVGRLVLLNTTRATVVFNMRLSSLLLLLVVVDVAVSAGQDEVSVDQDLGFSASSFQLRKKRQLWNSMGMNGMGMNGMGGVGLTPQQQMIDRNIENAQLRANSLRGGMGGMGGMNYGMGGFNGM